MSEGLAIVLEYESLPPPDARLLDPYRSGEDLLPTPTDERGLVNIPQLIADVKSTVDPSYEWAGGLDVHHFYWYASLYPYTKGDSNQNPAFFRNIPVHKGLVPRSFHEWLHVVTEPPPVPKPEVMQYRIEAWMVARDLFKMARQTVQWEKKQRRRRERVANNPEILREEFNGEDQIGEEVMHEVLEKNFRGFERQLERQGRIPEEFRILDISGTPKKVATNLGKLVARPSLYLADVIAA
jgi:hypothetical protein